MSGNAKEIEAWIIKGDHDLGTAKVTYLMDLISQKDVDFLIYYDSVSELQGYAVEVRYPNETIFLSKEKVETALLIAKKIRDIVLQKMNITLDYNEVIN
jgi:hypothetical protein